MSPQEQKPSRMKFVQELPQEQREQLEKLLKTSPNHRVRQRSHAILLSARGYAIEALADIFGVHRNTVSEWIDLWQVEGVESLEDAPRSGRPLKLSADEQQVLIAEIERNPRGITEALRAVKKRRERS